MLTAIARGKTRFYLRYKGHKDGLDEGRITAEDEITSLVFEPMRYLPAGDVAGFWQKFIGDGFFVNEPPVSFDVTFWPPSRYPENGKVRWVEPDLRVDFRWSDGSKRIILIEVKWNSALSEGQLLRQWRNCLNADERVAARHVFIGKHSDINSEDRHGRVVAKSWRDVQDILNRYQSVDGAVAHWAKLVTEFLGRVTTRPFNGFEYIFPLEEKSCRFYVSRDLFAEDVLCEFADLKPRSLSFYQH